MPLLYGKVLSLYRAHLRSLDFVVNCFFMKLFNTNNNILDIEFYRDQFNFELLSRKMAGRCAKFMNNV